MNTYCFLFPGQGSQQVGMLKDLYDHDAIVRARVDEVCASLGYDLQSLMFEGPMEQLTRTEHTQPALVIASTMLAEQIVSAGIVPTAVCGHSLGEYSALVASGSISFSDAVQLVAKRGMLMSESDPTGVGTMAAVLGLSESSVAAVTQQAQAEGLEVDVANANSPLQTVV
ncbi:MAG: ACP S-malonyltransferase, partial [Bacilli bacterium]